MIISNLYIFYFALVSAIIHNQESNIDKSILEILKEVKNQNHYLINKDLFSKLFEGEYLADKKIKILYGSLRRVYDILSDDKLSPLKELMNENYIYNDDLNLLYYESVIFSNFITRLTELSTYDIEFYKKVNYFSNDFFHEKLPINKKYKISPELYKKIKSIFTNEKNRLLFENANLFDKILIFEILHFSFCFDKIQLHCHTNLLFDLYEYAPNFDFITDFLCQKESPYEAFYLYTHQKHCGYISFSSSLLGSIYINYDKNSEKYETSLKDKPIIFEGVNKVESLDYLLNKEIILKDRYANLLISRIIYYSELMKKGIAIKIEKIDDFNTSIKIIIIGSCTISFILDYLKDTCESSKEMNELIQNNIKEDKLHEFTTVVDLITYNFKKPSDNSKGDLSSCLRLSCGHFIGKQLIEDYFISLKFKCHLCNVQTTVTNYFEAVLYEEEN